MRTTTIAAGLIALLTGGTAMAGDQAHPTVVELFQSQGCSSCPPADANLNAIAGRPDVLALNFAVTYWDRLGWKDTFAQPGFTQRQWDYARAGGRVQVATPQVIVDGRAVINGGDRAELDRTVAAARRTGPAIAAANGRVTVGAGGAADATVWLVGYDPRTIAVPIRAGENSGRTPLPHRNIVRLLVPLGRWTGKPAGFPLPRFRAADPNRRLAVLVQQGKGGPIVAAARL